MVHGVRLRDGRAEWYRNRWVRSRQVAAALGERGRGPAPCTPAWTSRPTPTSSATAGRTFATVEAGALPYELTDELDTSAPCDFDGTLPGGYAAHTKLDPATGELHAVAYFWGWDHVQHIVIGPDGQRSRGTADIPVADGPMMHDFALTEHYVVISTCRSPSAWRAPRRARQLPYAWNPTHPPRVGLLPRHGTRATSAGSRSTRAGSSTRSTPTTTATRSWSTWCRYPRAPHRPVRLDRAGAADAGPLDGRPGDRARCTSSASTTGRRSSRAWTSGSLARPHRYGYSAATRWVQPARPADGRNLPDAAFANALLKHDLATGTVEVHAFARDAAVGEAVFALASDGGRTTATSWPLCTIPNGAPPTW